jgi:Zn-dependent protease
MNPQTYKRLDQVCRPIQWLLGFATGIAGFVLCSLAAGDNSRTGPLLPFLFVALLAFATTIIHELGHYAAAKWAGMTVTQVRFGRIEVVPQQRGWRVRWNTQQKIQVGGFVLAVCDIRRPMRPQVLCMITGGPAANLLTALICAVLLVALTAWPLGVAFAIFNASAGILNLLPTTRGFGTDGLRLLIWGQKEIENSPRLASTRLQALSIAGVTADQLPVDQIAILDSQAMPTPFSALWYRLKAHQNRGEWLQAAQLQKTFDQLMEAIPKPTHAKLAASMAYLRTELAFSRAMQSRDAACLTDDLLPKALAWTVPTLWPRCLALRALLHGDVAAAQKLLDDVQHFAEQSMDKALPQSEVMIRRHMRALTTADAMMSKDAA